MKRDLQMVQSQIGDKTELYSGTYYNSFSRINSILIQAEQEAYNNFIGLSELLPDYAKVFIRLAKMEHRHREAFAACGHNLSVAPDLEFAEQFFTDLRNVFQNAAANYQIATCLLIQVLGIECFTFTLHQNYRLIADDCARKVTESIIDDKYSHFSLCEAWLKLHFRAVKDELKVANGKVLPIIRQMLNQVESDAQAIGISQYSLMEEFIVQYDEALSQIGFGARNILQMLSHALAANQADRSHYSHRSGVREIRLCS